MFLSRVDLTHRQEGPWNSGGNLFLSLTKVLGSATSSDFEVQRNWSHPCRQLIQSVADILYRSLLLRSHNVRCMVVNGNLGSRLMGVVGQAQRFSGELPVAGIRQDGNAQRCGCELPSAETCGKEPLQQESQEQVSRASLLPQQFWLKKPVHPAARHVRRRTDAISWATCLGAPCGSWMDGN